MKKKAANYWPWFIPSSFVASYWIYHPKLPSIENRQMIEINSFRFIAVRYPLQAKHLCTQSRFDLLIKMAKIEMKMNIGILIKWWWWKWRCYDVRSNLWRWKLLKKLHGLGNIFFQFGLLWWSPLMKRKFYRINKYKLSDYVYTKRAHLSLKNQ